MLASVYLRELNVNMTETSSPEGLPENQSDVSPIKLTTHISTAIWNAWLARRSHEQSSDNILDPEEANQDKLPEEPQL